MVTLALDVHWALSSSIFGFAVGLVFGVAMGYIVWGKSDDNG